MMPAMKYLLLALFLAVYALRGLLRQLNLSFLRRHGATVPPGFAAQVDEPRLHRAIDYAVAQSRLGFWAALVSELAMLWFLFVGGLGRYDAWISKSSDSFLLRGLVFFLLLGLAVLLLDLPFSLIRTFRIETRFGFNTSSFRLWLSDQLKGLLLSGVLSGGLLCAAFWLVSASPQRWWLWVWLLFALASLFLLYLSPTLIEPLFFKFTPLENPALEQGVRELMHKAGLEAGAVQQVDASRRSRHSNAYFTGIGRLKRIVLFDTLLQQMDDREVLAVLAHEIGHWKKGHVLLRLLWSQLASFAFLYGAYLLGKQPWLPELLGLAHASFFARILIYAVLVSLALFPLSPLSSWLSRRQEYQADNFATELAGEPGALADALIKLSRENLANLHPHPWYAWFYYAHPPVVERVSRLRSATPGG
jgi:STE24 endopeptidase